ncbi:hypothetical protein CSM33_000520 [Salmonella enterica subsp. diarizonae]|nr:hypothetical protein [Salmonella enterica]ECE1086292.1 hypothetical protein [Salmonella enterica subsp. diarizonae]EDQ4423025.1 hypothetical protein [Salmonella enterica subsp. salamae]ECF6078375.1 hypothetical protein [Salmonella enterica subsp. diarizonae]ECF7518486.1 hypothetical protein [Salmonella enterica subsp. diarizonae]
MEKNYDLVVLIAMFLCGSSFANDEYFSCDTAKGIIKLDVNKDELQYTLIIIHNLALIDLLFTRKTPALSLYSASGLPCLSI